MSKKNNPNRLCGIYIIRNNLGIKAYIGQSVDIKERWSQHRRELENKIHDNPHLQNAWNRDKAENFTFEIIELCSKDQLNAREKFWFDTYGFDNTYNILDEPNATPDWTGRKHTEETKNKMRILAKNTENLERLKNYRLRRVSKTPFQVIDLQGNILLFYNKGEFARNNLLDRSSLRRVLNGKIKSHKGFRLYVKNN